MILPNTGRGVLCSAGRPQVALDPLEAAVIFDYLLLYAPWPTA
jgi:hypothetical protein